MSEHASTSVERDGDTLTVTITVDLTAWHVACAEQTAAQAARQRCECGHRQDVHAPAQPSGRRNCWGSLGPHTACSCSSFRPDGEALA